MTTFRDQLEDAFSADRLLTQSLDELARMEQEVSDLGALSSDNANQLSVRWQWLQKDFTWFAGTLADNSEDWSYSRDRFLRTIGRSRAGRGWLNHFSARLTATVAFYRLFCLPGGREIYTNTSMRRKFLKSLGSLVRELHEAGVDLFEAFDAVLFDAGPQMVLYWERYFTVWKQLKSRAGKHRAFLLRFRASGQDLPDSVRCQALQASDRDRALLEDILNSSVQGRTMTGQQLRTVYRLNKGTPRSNSEVWTTILKNLEELLARHFPSEKTWEDKVIASKVYRLINRILNLCYPRSWPYDSKTAQSIKQRCHQHTTPRIVRMFHTA